MINLSNAQKIALLTDSTADLSPAMLEGKPIYVVPLKIVCDDGEYSDGVDIFAGDIYDRLHRGELPRTSLPAGGSISDALDRIRADGYEKVVAVMLSSGLSGTYNMVRIQAETRHDLEIAVFDSKSGSLGIGMIVLQLWEDIQAGMDWETLVTRRTPKLIENTFPFFSVDTLEYLSKGGRIGKVTAFAGTLLSIKPVISFAHDGQLQSVAKVRGRRQVQDKILDLMARHFKPGVRFNLAVANGGAQSEMAVLAERVRERFPNADHMWEGEIDATLSVYIGDGILGGGIQLLED
nr:DegV family protein [uncultured Flavonifractor sp.]